MFETSFSPAMVSWRSLAPASLLLGSALLLGACGSPTPPVQTTTMERTTTTQTVPMVTPSSTTTVTRTQQSP